MQVLKIATDTEGDAFDFIHFMETYSKIVYPFLLCSLFSAKQNDKQNDSLLSAENFAKQVSFTKITNVLSDLTALEHKLKTQYAPLLNFYEANITFDSFKQRLTDLGLTENEAYLFMRGHDILDRIAVKLMQNLGDALTKTHFGSLATNKEKADYYAYIKANSYEVVAEKNREMHNCAFYQRIVQDIQMAFQN